MEEVVLRLTNQEFVRIRTMSTAQAAVEVSKIQLSRTHPGAVFVSPTKGADLRVRLSSGVELDVEVKGTESAGIAWGQFKVSSQHSHDVLKTGIPVYRVTEIGSQVAKIFIMRHGVDFEMTHEPRWSVGPPRHSRPGDAG
jgi:hypothetical protein